MQRIIATIAIVASLFAFVGAQTCQECQTDNDVYCLNQTSYQNCMKNAAFGAVETCPTGTVCSNSADVCVDSSQVDGTTVLDVCGTSGGNDDCQVCATGDKFSCVSSTQFARCSSTGELITTTVYSCDEDEVCIIDSLSQFGTLCVPTCAADYVGMEATCSNSVYQPITTTAAPATTLSTEQRQQACRDAEPSSSPSYFYTRNYDDSACNSYLYCQKSGTDSWVALYMTCSASRPFFDVSVGNCVSTRPASCSDTTTSTSTVAPSSTPTDTPTNAPTDAPTDAPSNAPTDAPTNAPTDAPTSAPTDAPTDAPSNAPTDAPTDAPTNAASDAPVASRNADADDPDYYGSSDEVTEAVTEAVTDDFTKYPTEDP